MSILQPISRPFQVERYRHKKWNARAGNTHFSKASGWASLERFRPEGQTLVSLPGTVPFQPLSLGERWNAGLTFGRQLIVASPGDRYQFCFLKGFDTAVRL
jgi:hypothetical protein